MNILFLAVLGAAFLLMSLEVTREWRTTLRRRYWVWQLRWGKARVIVRYYGPGPVPAGTLRGETVPTGDYALGPNVEESDNAPPTAGQLRAIFENISRAHDRGELADREMDELVNQLLDAGYVAPDDHRG